MNSNNVFGYGYHYWRRLYNLPHNIKNFFRTLKWAKQRVTRGFCDYDVWSLDSYFCNLFAQSLRHLRDTGNSYPAEMSSLEEWQEALGIMADLFEQCKPFSEYYADCDNTRLADEQRNRDKDKAFDFMKKYFYDLWD